MYLLLESIQVILFSTEFTVLPISSRALPTWSHAVIQCEFYWTLHILLIYLKKNPPNMEADCHSNTSHRLRHMSKICSFSFSPDIFSQLVPEAIPSHFISSVLTKMQK